MIEIVDFQIGDETELSNLVHTVFKEFVAPDYSTAGNEFFYSFIQAENFISRFITKGDLILIAKSTDKMVGMIEIRDLNQISLLFVDEQFHGRGIAKMLFNESVNRCKQAYNNVDKFFAWRAYGAQQREIGNETEFSCFVSFHPPAGGRENMGLYLD